MKPELPTTPPSPFVILFRMRLKPGHRTHRADVWSPVIQCDAGRCTAREWPGGQWASIRCPAITQTMVIQSAIAQVYLVSTIIINQYVDI